MSRDTPWTKTGKTSIEVVAQTSGPCRIKEDLVVPAGTAVRWIGHWVVADLSWLRKLVTIASITYHDAVHYGIPINGAHISDVQPYPPRTP